MTRDAEEQVVQGRPALGVERCEELLLDPLDDRAEPGELPLPRRRQTDQVTAAVDRTALALDQATLAALAIASAVVVAVLLESPARAEGSGDLTPAFEEAA